MSLQKKILSLLYLIIICCIGISSATTLNSLKEDEVYKAAIDKGRQASDWFTKKSGKTTSSDYYADICAYYSSCIFGDATENSVIYEYINGRYTRTNAIITTDIDKNSCGILPLHLYLHNGKTQHLKLGTDAADVNIIKDGHFRGAIDDMYMTGSL